MLYTKQPSKESTVDSDLAHEQCFLEELLSVYNSLVKPLSRKSALDECLSNLCLCYVDLLHVTAVIVSTLLHGRTSHDVLQGHQEEILYVYDNYLSTVSKIPLVCLWLIEFKNLREYG